MKHFLCVFALCSLSLLPVQAQEHSQRNKQAKESATEKTREAEIAKEAEIAREAVPRVMPRLYDIPPSILEEHEELHKTLTALTRLPGKTGTTAKAVAALLLPHFNKEEEYALPNLALLPQLSQQKISADMRDAIALSEKLRKALPEMVQQHQQIAAALQTLMEAAKAEKRPEAVAFAKKLMLHARTEEEILYPAAILIGDYLKLKL